MRHTNQPWHPNRQMHDGMGFLTSHLALSSEFEDAMQAIHPSVSNTK